MAKPIKKKSNQDNSQLASAALALIVLALLLMYLDEKEAKGPPSTMGSIVGSAHSKKPNIEYSRINSEMQLTEGRMELNSLAREIENSEYTTPVRNIVEQMHAMPKLYNPLETEDTAGRVYKDLETRTSQIDAPYLPEDRINALIEKQLWLNHYDSQQKEEFIKAVITNARMAGFDIQINADLQVTNVRRVPNSAEPLKFPLKNSGSGTTGNPNGAR